MALMAIGVPFVPLTISCLLILTRFGLVGRGVSDPQIIMCHKCPEGRAVYLAV